MAQGIYPTVLMIVFASPLIHKDVALPARASLLSDIAFADNWATDGSSTIVSRTHAHVTTGSQGVELELAGHERG